MLNAAFFPYNARGNGTADDSSRLQRAIDDAVSSGGSVFIPAGTYLLATGLKINGAVTIEGAGGPSDTDGGFATSPQTSLVYTGSGVAITIIGDKKQGIKNVHLRDFMITGNPDAAGGILIGSAPGGGQQVNHSSIKNVTVVGFTRSGGGGAYGFGFRRCITSVFENCLARSCYDGFRFPSDAITTTLTFTNCHGYGCGRNALRVSAGASLMGSAFYGFVAETNGDAGLHLDGAQAVSFYSLYCEDNNKSSGAAPVVMLGSGAHPAFRLNFYSPYIQNPARGSRAFDFARAEKCVIFFPTLEWASSDWCAVTSETVNCVTYIKDGLMPGSVTGNAPTRMILVNPFSRNSGAAAAVGDGGAIPHGLGSTPRTARLSGSVAGQIVSIAALSATAITVAIKSNDGSAGTPQIIYWEAEL